MGSIPVLNDNQMNALRRIVGANQTFDLTVAPRGKSRRLPEYTDEAVSDSEYNGYFKAVLEEVTQGGQTIKRVRIINGADPKSNVCGHTDIGDVNAATLTYSANASIYLVAQYANKAFSFSFTTTKPSNDALNTGWVEIANMLTDDKVQQVWTGGTIYFGERYFI